MDTRRPNETGTLPVSGDEALQLEPTGSVGEMAEWLSQAREDIAVPGKYIAYDDDGRRVIVSVQREWTRIGRSLAADVRFDDATVSRRHALVVNQADGMRVLDDRSLNGVYVNGRRVEWSPLRDGDEIVVGRHSLFFIDTATVGSADRPAVAAAE